jgi:hypothetical protein
MKTRTLWMLVIGWVGSMGGALAVTPSHTETNGGSGLTLPSRPRAPQSVDSSSRPLSPLSVVEFLNVLGSVPSASGRAVLPMDETQRIKWEAEVSQWRREQTKLLERIKALLPGRPGRLSEDTFGALTTLKSHLESRQDRGTEAYQVFSSEALAVAHEAVQFLVAYSEAYAATAADPGQTKAQRQRKAFEDALRSQPEGSLSSPAAPQTDALTPHHRTQLEELLTLRKALRTAGDLEGFAAMLRKDTRPSRTPNTVAKR